MRGLPRKDYVNLGWLDPDKPRLYDWYDEYPYDLEAWHTICRQSGDPILDVGCGTGRVSIELARRGLRVVGLDISPPMIARANEKLAREDKEVRRRVSFVIADMADFDLRRRFPTAIIPCFSFHELTTLAAQEACLRTLSRHLRRGGLLAIVLGALHRLANAPEPEEPSDWGKPKEEGLNPHTGRFTRMWSLSWGDPATQMRYHRFYFEELDENGQLLRRFAAPAPPAWSAARFLGRYEMELLLEKCGFATENVCGDWDLKPFDPRSPCMLFLARKVGRAR